MTALTDRMRTCAAFIMGTPREADTQEDVLLKDAADLLIEAAHLIDMTPAPLGEPMEIIEPSHTPIPPTIDRTPSAIWMAPGDTLPVPNQYRSRHTCPKCDSRASKIVRRVGNRMMIVCPACAGTWEYKR